MDMTSPNSRVHLPAPPNPTFYPHNDANTYSYKTDEYDLYEVPEHDLNDEPLPAATAARATYNIVAQADDVAPVLRTAMLSLVNEWLVTGIDVAHWRDVRTMVEHYVPATAPYLANVRHI